MFARCTFIGAVVVGGLWQLPDLLQQRRVVSGGAVAALLLVLLLSFPRVRRVFHHFYNLLNDLEGMWSNTTQEGNAERQVEQMWFPFRPAGQTGLNKTKKNTLIHFHFSCQHCDFQAEFYICSRSMNHSFFPSLVFAVLMIHFVRVQVCDLQNSNRIRLSSWPLACKRQRAIKSETKCCGEPGRLWREALRSDSWRCHFSHSSPPPPFRGSANCDIMFLSGPHHCVYYIVD